MINYCLIFGRRLVPLRYLRCYDILRYVVYFIEAAEKTRNMNKVKTTLLASISIEVNRFIYNVDLINSIQLEISQSQFYHFVDERIRACTWTWIIPERQFFYNFYLISCQNFSFVILIFEDLRETQKKIVSYVNHKIIAHSVRIYFALVKIIKW